MMIDAWHFVGDRLRDGRPVPDDGAKLVHKGNLVLCIEGLHASHRVIDALYYAPGPICCRVQLSGTIIEDKDKFVASERTILWRIDATDVLWRFSRRCALDVAYLWDMPPVVREYLETGNRRISDAAWAAARKVSRNTTRPSKRHAAWVASWATTRDAARARTSATVAAWEAVRDIAYAIAGSSVTTAAWHSAWDAACAEHEGILPCCVPEVTTAEKDIVFEKQNSILQEMIMEASIQNG